MALMERIGIFLFIPALVIAFALLGYILYQRSIYIDKYLVEHKCVFDYQDPPWVQIVPVFNGKTTTFVTMWHVGTRYYTCANGEKFSF